MRRCDFVRQRWLLPKQIRRQRWLRRKGDGLKAQKAAARAAVFEKAVAQTVKADKDLEDFEAREPGPAAGDAPRMAALRAVPRRDLVRNAVDRAPYMFSTREPKATNLRRLKSRPVSRMA